MVNRLARRRRRLAGLALTKGTVPVMYTGAVTQWHGRVCLKPNEWVDVPEGLARRLLDCDGYEVDGLGHVPRCRAKEGRGWKIGKDAVKRLEMERWPSVAIVVPVFNSPDLLATCLEGLDRTEYGGPTELVLVDNASTDAETLRLLRSSGGSRTRTVRFEEPVGFSAAVNAGMKAAKDADYFLLFNQDCEVIEPDWLMWLVNWMEQRAECAIAGARLLHPDGTIQHAGIWILPNGDAGHLGEGKHGDHPDFQYYERVPAVTGAVFAIRNAFVNREGAFDEEYLFGCEDIEYCLRADVAGQEVWYVPNAVVRHDAHGVCRENRSDADRIQRWQSRSHAKFRREWVLLLDAIARRQVGVVVPTVAGREGRAGRALADYLVNCGIETTLFVAHGEVHDLRPGQLHRARPLSEFTSIDTVVTLGGKGGALSHGLAARQRFDWTCEEALSDRRGCLHKILGGPVGRRNGMAAW